MRVFISDVNDNKPVFAQRLYEVGVDENADVGLAVVTVSANDEDEGRLGPTADPGGCHQHLNCAAANEWKRTEFMNKQRLSKT